MVGHCTCWSVAHNRLSFRYFLSLGLSDLEALIQQLHAHFLLHPQAYLGSGLLLLLVVLGLAAWLLWRLGSRQRDLGERLETALQELKEELQADQQVALQRHQESIQHGLQSLQAVISDKVSVLEKEILKDGSALKLELVERFELQKKAVAEALSDARMAQQREGAELRQSMDAALGRHRESSEALQREAIKVQQETLANTLNAMGQQVQESFKSSSDQLGKRVEQLTRTTDDRLKDITGQVEKRLSEGVEKTTETFSKVLEHLTRIDEAQKKITELSGNVVSLQEVLTDKRSRGAFGEVQLSGLVRNVMPEGSFEMQATLSNGKRVDCLLRLPDPTGDVAIDAKFPLESYQRMMDIDLPDGNRASAATQFRKDIRKHISDISSKYLIAGETADGAVMFLPAEAVFAEIHAHFPDLVEEAQRARVWMVSPTTLMAVLTTARAVLKDDATRKQVHVIQDHLRKLSEDFGRFRQRMDKLATHIRQAKEDVDQVNTSARKITGRFLKIDQVEIQDDEAQALADKNDY